jgi:uncharacterized surface anchored protein
MVVTVTVGQARVVGTFVNRTPGELTWQKRVAGAPQLLAGATFKVTGPAGFTAVTVTDNQAPDQDPADGIFRLTGLTVAGTYTITETVAPAGYVLDATPQQVQVVLGEVANGGNFVNEPSLTVYVQKMGVDVQAQSVPMAGSEWQVVTDVAGQPGTVVSTVTLTDMSGSGFLGVWRVEGIVAGTYWLMETRAPDGFNLLAQPLKFTVASDGVVVLGAGNPSSVVSVAAGTGGLDPWWVVTVHDVPALVFPVVGGAGVAPLWWATGVLGVVFGVVLLLVYIRYRRAAGAARL